MSGIASGSPTEDIIVLAAKVGTASSTPLASGAADMRGCAEALVTVAFGDMAAETIDVKLQSCDADGTSNVADITGRAITQLAANAANNDNKVVKIALKVEDLIPSGKRYFRALVTTGGVTGGATAIVIHGIASRYGANVGESAAVLQNIA